MNLLGADLFSEAVQLTFVLKLTNQLTDQQTYP